MDSHDVNEDIPLRHSYWYDGISPIFVTTTFKQNERCHYTSKYSSSESKQPLCFCCYMLILENKISNDGTSGPHLLYQSCGSYTEDIIRHKQKSAFILPCWFLPPFTSLGVVSRMHATRLAVNANMDNLSLALRWEWVRNKVRRILVQLSAGWEKEFLFTETRSSKPWVGSSAGVIGDLCCWVTNCTKK